MKIRKSYHGILTRILCLAMALHFFNFSIDSRDANPDYIPEDLAINDIESVIELFTEDVCGIDNAIAEHDEPDSSDGGCFEFSKIFVQSSNSIIELPSAPDANTIVYFISNSRIGESISQAIVSPPPQQG